jgi:uncharacterized protein
MPLEDRKHWHAVLARRIPSHVRPTKRPSGREVEQALRAGPWRPGWFFVLTFIWSWLFWGAAAATDRSWNSPIVLVLFAVGGAGPVLAAGVLLRLCGDRDVERDFWRRVLDARRVPGRWWTVVVALALAPPVSGLLATGAEGPWVDPGAVTVLVVALVAGVLEEPGWRGYAVEGLARRHHVLVAAAVVGVAWPLWHLPLFFLEGSYQSDLGVGSFSFWVFLGSLFLLSFVYAWVYVGTNGSILAVIVLHALANGFGEVLAGERSAGMELVTTAVLALLAAGALSRRASGAPVAPPRPAHDDAGRPRLHR